jgi:hypothetical protein
MSFHQIYRNLTSSPSGNDPVETTGSAQDDGSAVRGGLGFENLQEIRAGKEAVYRKKRRITNDQFLLLLYLFKKNRQSEK